MLLLNAVERADSKCYCLLDTGANALVMTGTEAQLGVHLWKPFLGTYS